MEYSIVVATIEHKEDKAYDHFDHNEMKSVKFDSYESARVWLYENGLRLTKKNGMECLFYIEEDDWRDYSSKLSYCFSQESYNAAVKLFELAGYYMCMNVKFIKENGEHVDFMPLESKMKKIKQFLYDPDILEIEKRLVNENYFIKCDYCSDCNFIYLHITKEVDKELKFLLQGTHIDKVWNKDPNRLYLKIFVHINDNGLPTFRELENICNQLNN